MEIVELSNKLDLLDEAVNYFWRCWGNESNLAFYKDCIEHSVDKENLLPKFYLAIDNSEIIGSYALLTNDIISRQDLIPWFACLYVNEEYRNRGIADKLLEHGLKEASQKNFGNLYLSSDLINFYEKKGWKVLGNGFNLFGEKIKIYSKSTKEGD